MSVIILKMIVITWKWFNSFFFDSWTAGNDRDLFWGVVKDHQFGKRKVANHRMICWESFFKKIEDWKGIMIFFLLWFSTWFLIVNFFFLFFFLFFLSIVIRIDGLLSSWLTLSCSFHIFLNYNFNLILIFVWISFDFSFFLSFSFFFFSISSSPTSATCTPFASTSLRKPPFHHLS